MMVRLPIDTWLSLMRTRFGQISNYLIARRRRAKQLQDLYGMNDRELWDLGLSRSDFPAIEDGTYRRDQRSRGLSPTTVILQFHDGDAHRRLTDGGVPTPVYTGEYLWM